MSELFDFIKHLRINYNIFILSSSFLLGGLLSDFLSPTQFFIQFFVIHILLFGGVNAYNSYCDKDESAIGGLKHPPKMKPWMNIASWVIQIIGGVLALWVNNVWYIIGYIAYVFSSWLYSSPITRFKAKPLISVFMIGFGNGYVIFFLGLLSAGVQEITLAHYIAAIGMSIITMSFYPISQVYQIKEDEKRNDMTFTRKYGLKIVKLFFSVAYFLGIVCIGVSLWTISYGMSLILIILSLITYYICFSFIKKLKGQAKEYSAVMYLKYIPGSLLSIVIIVVGFITHF